MFPTFENTFSDQLSRIAQAEANIIDGTVAVPTYPVGNVLPPLEAAEPVGTVEVTHDGAECSYRYDGPSVVNPGQSIRIVTVNERAIMSGVAVLASESGGLASAIAVDPNPTRVGCFVATDGRSELRCGSLSTTTELMTIEVR